MRETREEIVGAKWPDFEASRREPTGFPNGWESGWERKGEFQDDSEVWPEYLQTAG